MSKSRRRAHSATHRGGEERHKANRRWFTCEQCGKRGFYSRTAARAAARAAHPDDGTLQAYQCPRAEAQHEVWHYGHVPSEVRSGQLDKWDYLNGRQRDGQPLGEQLVGRRNVPQDGLF